MVDATHISFVANDRSYFSLIKKEIRRMATEAGVKASRINELDIIVAEMTSNLHKYSDDGEILAGAFANEGNPYMELICIDNGPGINNPGKMLGDGTSTSNTLGHGLGSMNRLSDTFEIYSQPGWGGHGPEANKAVNEAAAAFRVFPDYSPAETLRFIHASIKKSRGAVINIVGYNFTEKIWTSAGVGNIALRLNGPVTVKNHMSYNGIVGHNIPNTINDQVYTGEQLNQVLLTSDGIKTRIDFNRYPQMFKYDPGILAAAIYKDHARRTDDMSVVIAKLK
ncbi:MAG: serine/threonine protein kinase [Sphingobacteriales bacterium]|nr:MAG: serine/threonine protein kinase [Sphingobacteriales bacterium]